MSELTVQVPGQRGANITMCLAISEDCVAHPRCLANDNIHCDVDENLRPNPQDEADGNRSAVSRGK
ncbi:hypothetical protein R3I94_003109 [Phoxinus phoxinus]